MARLRWLLIGVLCALSVGARAAEDPALGAAERAAIRSVIESQMAAFRRDDGVAAFSYAAPDIQAKFGTPEIFMDMVRTGYAAVYRPRDVEFLEALVDNERIVQPVRMVGPDGEAVIALYHMEQQPDGRWRIAGVVLIRTGEVAS
jgi:hypothetical protein